MENKEALGRGEPKRTVPLQPAVTIVVMGLSLRLGLIPRFPT